MRADLIRPGGDTVEISVILQGYVKALGNTLQNISNDSCAIYIHCVCQRSPVWFELFFALLVIH